LPKDELGRADRCHHDLLKRTDLTFAHHGEGRQVHDEHESEAADDARHEKPAAAEVRVVPGTLLKFDRGDSFDHLARDAVDAILLVILRKA
jgi:hypothetical protein